MISLLYKFFSSKYGENRRRLALENFEHNQISLDNILSNETEYVSTTFAIKQTNFDDAIKKYCQSFFKDAEEQSEEVDEGPCYNRIGLVTRLEGDHGVIDFCIIFDLKDALLVERELVVGCRVRYLAYQREINDQIQVIKLEEVIENNWDDKLTREQMEREVYDLKKDKPQYFNTHTRNVLGMITERKQNDITINTPTKDLQISLDSIEIDFIPKVGDHVAISCEVQSDNSFVDKQGEILKVYSVQPSRILKDEICTVSQLQSDWGVLDKQTYFTFDILCGTGKLIVGDKVKADMIECNCGTYTWRALKLSTIKNTKLQTLKKMSDEGADSSSAVVQKAVTIEDDKCVVFSDIDQKEIVEMGIKNNAKRLMKCTHIDFQGNLKGNQLRLIEPEPGQSIELQVGGECSVRFEAESKLYGESREVFIFHFESFKVKRSITIVVNGSTFPVGDERIKAHERYNNRYYVMREKRAQADKLWSKRVEVIPGEGYSVKRRFIAHRIRFYEIPETLRQLYLSSEDKMALIDNVECSYVCLQEKLNFSNYVKRFQTLIHLEEIECFINFRTFDQDRAHFNRDGDFLSLPIDNLFERRPSLVVGDTVRATCPWNDMHKRSYEGIIHKVLCDRVLFKFNQFFQNSYNGEDHCLEFHFSRFPYRKQHYAVERAVADLGQHFLFPTRMEKRSHPQLDIELDEEHNLCLRGKKCVWYNPMLNHIQKRAIRNILHGEVQNMPYVIFGPPGTGKTVTLIETIIQLSKLLPSSRVLVGTPSNSSADLITSHLIDSKALQPGEFIRLISQNQIDRETIPEQLLPYCVTVDIGLEGTCENTMVMMQSGLKMRCQEKFLGQHRITIGTCITLGNLMQVGFARDHFTHVIIDESGQCTEPEAMVVISQISKVRGQVILAGDPRQLHSVVINAFAGKLGFSLSFLERILDRTLYLRDPIRFPDTCGFDPRLVTKLLYNYRALPCILNVYNDLFYDSELIPTIDENSSPEACLLSKVHDIFMASENCIKSHGVFFIGVSSPNMQTADSPSWFNPCEAQNVFLTTIKLYRRDIGPDKIGIITPYSKQVKHLRNVFSVAGVEVPKIGTVEEFQGQERDIILISTVRSEKEKLDSDLRHALGFVQSPKRMNVAVSRARSVLCVFGNPILLSMDNCWNFFINSCIKNGSYSGMDITEIFN